MEEQLFYPHLYKNGIQKYLQPYVVLSTIQHTFHTETQTEVLLPTDVTTIVLFWPLLLYGEETGSKVTVAKPTHLTTQHITVSETMPRKASFHVLSN